MKHIGMTLGPITNTMMLGRKTSEIWGASYLFSSFMKAVIKELKSKSGVQFLIPYVADESLFNTQDDGIGMFHDRFILTSETLTINDVNLIVQEQKVNFGKMIAEGIKKEESKVIDFFNNYLQTYLFESGDTYTNPVLEISSILDSMELHTPVFQSDEDYMRLFLNRNTLLHSSMIHESFGKTKVSFDSIEAIAAQEKDKNIENSKEFKNAAKYIAIIHADGDNLGEYIKGHNDVSVVSKNLFEFDKQAVSIIKEFGALPLFVGGDDLLIFAPVINKEKNTVIDLVDKLSDAYKNALQTDKSTLSFGISITYYKYPLYEALAKSRIALFDKAKGYVGKNAIALSVQKHSGQSFDFCIGKNDPAYKSFSELLQSVLSEEVELPHAIHHKIAILKPLLSQIMIERLDDTFDNFFNEDLHKSKFKQGLNEIKKLIKDLGLGDAEQETFFAMLSTIKLLRGDR
jgi:CRISPR-associated protein Cmr2